LNFDRKNLKTMFMKKTFTLLLLAFYASSIFAHANTFDQGKIKQKHYLQRISYQEIKGDLIVPVTINGKNYNFLFDTGCTMSAISDKIYKELNLPIVRQINAQDASGETEKIRFILIPEIDIQGITFWNTQAVVFPDNPYNESVQLAECIGIDGVIGSKILKNSIVQFDEQNKHIVITNDIKRILLQNSECQKVRLSLRQGAPYFKITLQKGGRRVAHEVLFDSGDAGGFFTLSLNKLNDCIIDQIAESEGSFEIGVHGAFKKQKHLLLSIPQLGISGTIFNDVIVTTTNANYSRIGTKLLQYGKTTLDYKKKRFYFEPFDSINTIKPVETPLTTALNFQNGKLVVGIIWDKALESQINLGDEILSINGIDIQSMNLCELYMLTIPPSDKNIWELRDINTETIKKIEIELMQLRK